MGYSSSATHENECSTKEVIRKEKSRGVTMMAKLTKVCNSGVRLPDEFDHKIWTCYGKNYSFFRSYAVLLGRSKVIVLIDDW